MHPASAPRTLSAACRYSFGSRPSTGNCRVAGGCSCGSTRAAVANAEMAIPCHADTICAGGPEGEWRVWPGHGWKHAATAEWHFKASTLMTAVPRCCCLQRHVTSSPAASATASTHLFVTVRAWPLGTHVEQLLSAGGQQCCRVCLALARRLCCLRQRLQGEAVCSFHCRMGCLYMHSHGMLAWPGLAWYGMAWHGRARCSMPCLHAWKPHHACQTPGAPVRSPAAGSEH